MSQHKVKKEYGFAGLSILMIPLFTLLFGFKESPAEHTLSVIGNRFDARVEFITWGILSAVLFTFYMMHLFKMGVFFNPDAKLYAWLSGLFLILTVITPALREIWPILNKLHAVFGAFFGVFLVVAIFFFIKYIRYFDKRIYRISLALLLITVGGSISCLFILGNTGVYEIYFFVTVSILLFIMEAMVRKRKHLFIKQFENLKMIFKGKKR